jgi:transposase InsO family protein
MQKEKYQTEIVLELVRDWRKSMPRIGGRKLYSLLEEDFQSLEYKLGRDAFFDILREYGMLVKRRKSYTKTTNSFHHYRVYQNLILGLKVDRPNQVFVADITYIRVAGGFMYLSLLTDLYSRKIVGWYLGDTLDAECSVMALKMALKEVKDLSNLIHHSDRGVQYCCREYTRILLASEVSISMAEVGNPYENAVAERINGILKDEFYLDQVFASKRLAVKATEEAIRIYNNLRPHLSLKMQTPSQVYADFEEEEINDDFSRNFFPPRGESLVGIPRLGTSTTADFINN